MYRFRATRDPASAAFVGRDAELALVLDRWAMAVAGEVSCSCCPASRFSSCFQLPLVRTSLFGFPRGPLEPVRILPAAPDLPEEVVLVSNSIGALN